MKTPAAFITARLQLTVWYTLVILFISVTLSGLFFARTVRVMAIQNERLGTRLKYSDIPGRVEILPPTAGIQVLNDEFFIARDQIRLQLFFINLIVVTIGAAASYFLSGRTLQPIEQVLLQQQRFVADAAHEFKTPLTAMKTALEVSLMDRKLATKARTVLQENLIDISNLQALTEHLLVLAQTDEQPAQEFALVDIHSVVQETVTRIQPLAEQKNITLVTKITGQKSTRQIDPVLLAQLLLILLDNAVKYTPSGGQIRVSVHLSNAQLRIDVQDTGIGIAKHHLPHIFDRFYRVESARSKSGPSGHGLGLSVAKKIVDQHDGVLSVDSQLEHGSTFTVQLPLS